MAQREDVTKLSLLEKAVEAAPDGIAILDDTDRFIYANRRYVELFGVGDRTALIGQEWRTAIPDREHDFVETEILPEVNIYSDWRGEVIAEDHTGRPQRIDLSIKDVGEARVWFARAVAVEGSSKVEGESAPRDSFIRE